MYFTDCGMKRKISFPCLLFCACRAIAFSPCGLNCVVRQGFSARCFLTPQVDVLNTQGDGWIGTLCVCVCSDAPGCLHVCSCFCAVMVFDGRIYCLEALKVSLSGFCCRSSRINTFVVLGSCFFFLFFTSLPLYPSPSVRHIMVLNRDLDGRSVSAV